MMDGRVKTLHPKIHMGLLARKDHAEDAAILKSYGVSEFDLVVVNLYPFEQALFKGHKGDELIEYIDIGGPSMLRAAAKSFNRLAVVCDPKDYQWILQKSELTQDDRQKLAAKVYAHTACYDSLIARTLNPEQTPEFAIGGEQIMSLRYGENPQQQASWYRGRGENRGLFQAEILQGKALSYNNILDLDAAIGLVREFDEPCAVAVKHNNPCGVAVAKSISEATDRAIKADPVSVFGGIIALNKTLDVATAETLSQLFLECIVAPDITDDAMKVFTKKKNLRILKWPQMCERETRLEVKTVSGGFLVQTSDQIENTFNPEWKVIGATPSAEVKRDLMMAWKLCSFLKSNAIALAGGGQSLGLGMGQVNRVEAVGHAIERMQQHHPEAQNIVMASDAFFPFKDSVEAAARANIKWIIQPGGSISDSEVIAAAQSLGVNMVLTGVRHFRH
jgi:phosphoribosylaminoimidazolecarboxamide formyltransferase/IMP cyclohydrolase